VLRLQAEYRGLHGRAKAAARREQRERELQAASALSLEAALPQSCSFTPQSCSHLGLFTHQEALLSAPPADAPPQPPILSRRASQLTEPSLSSLGEVSDGFGGEAADAEARRSMAAEAPCQTRLDLG